jgi:RNA polymerase sigma factor (sigma-70 family)
MIPPRRDQMPSPSSPEAMAQGAYDAKLTGEPLFLACLPLIQRLTTRIALSHRLPADWLDDFGSVVLLRIIKDDYAVLSKFRGRSTVRTYLTVVIHRILQDYRTSQWGKWRASSASRRQGPEAVALERLMLREGLTFDQACQVLEAGGMTIDRSRLAEQAAVFQKAQKPLRAQRRADEDEAERLPSTEESVEEEMVDAEIADHATTELAAVVRDVPPRDRLMLQLRFFEGLSSADIARRLRLDPRGVYKQWERLLSTLRARLETRGVRRHEVLKVLGRPRR